jgi:hypothetical protein
MIVLDGKCTKQQSLMDEDEGSQSHNKETNILYLLQCSVYPSIHLLNGIVIIRPPYICRYIYYGAAAAAPLARNEPGFKLATS